MKLHRSIGPSRRWFHVHILALIAAMILLVFPASLSARPRRDRSLASKITLRARVIAMTPEDRVRIPWVVGGWGLTSGDPITGELTRLETRKPVLDEQPFLESRPDDLDLEDGPANPDVVTMEGRVYDYQWLNVGVWSPEVTLASLRTGRFITFQALGQKTGNRSRDVVMEFELRFEGQSIKSFTEAGPDGPTFGVILPMGLLSGYDAPPQAFLDHACGLSAYVSNKVAQLRAYPWAEDPLPVRFGILSDCGGYGIGAGYGVRTTSRSVVLAETEAMRLLGMNGFRGQSRVQAELVRSGEGLGLDFRRVKIGRAGGYPVVSSGPLKPWESPNPNAGCPYNEQALALQAAEPERLRSLMEELRESPVQEFWGLTDDEIGPVFGGAPEGRGHIGCCPHCRRAFHEFLQRKGVGLEAFGATNWADIRAFNGYWTVPYLEAKAAREAAAAAALPQPDIREVREEDVLNETVRDAIREIEAAAPEGREEELPEPESTGVAEGGVLIGGRLAPLSPAGASLLKYYTARFINEASARLFTPKDEFFKDQNARKRRALEEGRIESPEANQPWTYCYALRGNTFLMGGSVLDFFDFYRHADNGFMYETSNRDPRIWQWDSYLCDVGRILVEKGLVERFGLYVKPHRGAPIQRALAAAAREAKVIYWYTYGPEWSKGDSFGGNATCRAAVSRADRLIAAAEDLLYEGRREPAVVAVVRPFTSFVFENNASWENGKWVYTALMNAHLQVDPLDEGLLLSEDLSRYKAIYVSGSHLRRDAAAKLAAWVEQGGTLYTSAFGLARDEANQPLTALQPVLGLPDRRPPELWRSVRRYGAVGLPGFAALTNTPAEGADALMGEGALMGAFQVRVGREILRPAPKAEVLARFGDGQVAALRHRYGNGWAYVMGFYPGLEYASDLVRGPYDMSVDLDPVKRAFVAEPARLAGAAPVVDLSHPMCDGILLRSPKPGRAAVALMNWTFRTRQDARPETADELDPAAPPRAPFRDRRFVPAESVHVTVRGIGPIASVRSCWNRESVSFEQRGADLVLTLPLLEEADVLVLEAP
jgi:hypothetical protein